MLIQPFLLGDNKFSAAHEKGVRVFAFIELDR